MLFLRSCKVTCHGDNGKFCVVKKKRVLCAHEGNMQDARKMYLVQKAMNQFLVRRHATKTTTLQNLNKIIC